MFKRKHEDDKENESLERATNIQNVEMFGFDGPNLLAPSNCSTPRRMKLSNEFKQNEILAPNSANNQLIANNHLITQGQGQINLPTLRLPTKPALVRNPSNNDSSYIDDGQNNKIKKQLLDNDQRIPYFTKFYECLNKYENSEISLCHGKAHELPIAPWLEIIDFGPVFLPLVDPQATHMINKSQQLISPSVVNVYHMNPNQFIIKNPEWHENFQSFVDRVAIGLGRIDGKVEAKLIRLTLHKQDSSHRKCIDIYLRDPKIFGVLLVQLPSIFTGGGLTVIGKDNESINSVAFDETNTYGMISVYYAAYTKDSEIVYERVKSGYRLLLVYTLSWTIEGGKFLRDIQISDELLIPLRFLNTQPYSVAILLENFYTQQSITNAHGFARDRNYGAVFGGGFGLVFRGLDSDRFGILKIVNERLDEDKRLSFFVTHANLIIEYEDQHAFDSSVLPGKNFVEVEKTIQMKDWIDENGSKFLIGNNATVEPNYFTFVFNPSSKTSTNLSLDLMEESSWGKHKKRKTNEPRSGHAKRVSYSRMLLICLPKKFEFDFLLGIDVKCVLEKLRQISNKNLDPQNRADYLNKLEKTIDAFDKMINNKMTQTHKEDDEWSNQFFLKEILKLLEKANDLNLIRKAFKYVKSIFIEIDAEFVAKLIAKYGYDEFKNVLEPFVKPCAGNTYRNCWITKGLISIYANQNLALKWYNERIMPIINNHVEFSHLIRYNYISQNPMRYNRESIFFELARLILSFDEQLETISKFKELIKKSINKVKIDEMLTELKNVMSLHEQSKPAADSLFEINKNDSENIIKI